MLSELKTITEYETYEDYVESREVVGLGVVPKDFFEGIKETRSTSVTIWISCSSLQKKRKLLVRRLGLSSKLRKWHDDTL